MSNLDTDYKIDETQLESINERLSDDKEVKITKEHLDVLKNKLPSRRVMRKVLRKRGRSFSQELYEKFRKQKLNK